MSRNARSRMGRAIKAAPSFSLDFTRGVLDPRLTFTRASGATFIGSDGLLQTAASNAPRFDYDPITLACKGLLIEEARTNLVPVSRSWGIDGTTVAQTQTGADGTTNAAFLVTESATTNTHRGVGAAVSFVSGTAYVLAALVKPGTATRCQLTTASAVSVGYANFSLVGAGSVLASGSVTSAGIRPYGNGFYLCWMVVTSAVTSSLIGVLAGFIDSDTATRAPSYLGTGLTLILDHAQIEVGAFPTSIIPTSGAAATRAADVCNAALATWFNSREGVLAAEFRRDVISSTALSANARIVALRQDASNATELMCGTGTPAQQRLSVTLAGSTAVSINQLGTPGALYRLAGSYSRDNFNAAQNGVLGTPDTAGGLPAPVVLDVGNFSGAAQLNGHIRAVDYYPVALEPQTLRRLTSATESPARRINPDFSLHFLDGVLDSRITFTRASSGTRINSAGVLVTETTNAPRFDYDPITLACKGLLIEEARTNLETSSRVTATGNGLASVTQNAAGADAATNTAWTIGEDTASTTHTTSTAGTVAYVLGTTYSLTRLVKPGTATKCQITGTVAIFGTTFYANFSLVGAGSVLASGAGTTATIKPGPNGFYACTITGAATATAAGVGNAVAFINTDTDTRLPSFTGASRTLIVDHAQAEAGAFPTSIIPTTGAAATRAGDAVLVTGSNFSSVYNATQGTLAAEFIRTNGDSGSGSPGLFQADDGSSNNRTALRLNSRLANAAAQGTVVVGGSVITNTGSTSSALQGGVVRATMSYAMAGGNASVAGGTAGAYTLTALPTACTQFAIGGGGGSLGATALNGHMRHIDYYKQALPADFITELSR